jgi:hypothetical protein
VLVAFTECLRKNGVKIPRPNTSGKGPLLPAKAINSRSPQYRAAATKCRSVISTALRESGLGGARKR